MIQWRFLFARPTTETYASVRWDDGKEVCLLQHQELESFSNEVRRSDCIISGPAMFCTSMPTRRVRTKIAGTMETSIHSRSFWTPLQASPLYDSKTVKIRSVSTIKAGGTISFIKDPLNNHLNIDPNTNFIRMVYQCGPANPWMEAPPITKAVNGSSFAVVRSSDLDAKQIVARIYYQDHELCLKECYYSPLGTTDQWVFGE